MNVTLYPRTVDEVLEIPAVFQEEEQMFDGCTSDFWHWKVGHIIFSENYGHRPSTLVAVHHDSR